MNDKSYRESDVSRSTHFSNFGVRTGRPIGYCIHTTAGTNSLAFLQSDRRFTSGASCADFLIERDGKRYKLLPEGKFAYHIGKGRWGNLTNDEDTLSQRLIGVELEQAGDQFCTWEQLDSLAELVVSSAPEHRHRWPFVLVGHYELATPLGRRSDPQGFDWGAFMGFLYTRSLHASIGGLITLQSQKGETVA